MKKSLLALVLSLVFLGASVAVFAQGSAVKPSKPAKHADKATISGTIVSIDEAKKDIVVKVAKTGKDKTIAVTEEQLKQIKVGNEVKITLRAGKAETITVAAPAPAPEAPAAPAATK